jgi:hypothetical protein
MPFEFGSKSSRDDEATEYLERAVSKQREYRNGVGLAVPSEDQIESLRRAVRYLVAVEQVRSKSKQLNLTDAQKDQLRERESTERAAAESAFLKLYTEIWLPQAANGSIAIEKIGVGGRPLQATLNEKRRAMIHQRIIELITTVQPRVFGTVTPSKIADLFKLGQGDPPKLGIRTANIVAGFYSFVGYPRLTSEAVIRRAIAEGIEKGIFGYTTGAPNYGEDGRYQIDRSKVAYDQKLAEDEVDLQSGFLMLPAALPLATPLPAGPAPQPPPGSRSAGPGLDPQPGGAGDGPQPPSVQTTVELAFSADRNQLFTAWNALANLADLAGTISVTVRATAEAGFNRMRLENGVLEPLRETKLID